MALRPKLHEVSQIAGVSLATVSRVLNAKPGVAIDTRQKVLATLADLGYQEPVRSTRVGVVAIITPELNNPIFPALAQTIEARLARFGLLTMICPVTSDTVNEQEYLDHFLETKAAGVVVVNGRYAATDVGFDAYDPLLRRSIPVVLVNGVAGECPVPAVAVDIARGGEMAVRHLAHMGHTRIGVLAGPRRYASTLQLLTGYEAAMSSLGLSVDDSQVSETLFTLEGGRAGVATLIEAGMTAVICGGDLMALGAIDGLRARNLETPADMSIVGFDGTELVSYTDPPLTSIRQPVDRMAASVAFLLQNQDSAGTRVHLFQPDLVIGRTTGRVPA
jgi:LacI family transcriptional regulator, repressor for deo operon, udp, cdd, tsx, nupC, and nupG